MLLFGPIKAFAYFLYYIIAGAFLLEHRPTVFAAACIAIVAWIVDYAIEGLMMRPKATLWTQASLKRTLDGRIPIENSFAVAIIGEIAATMGISILITFGLESERFYYFSNFFDQVNIVGWFAVFSLPGLLWLIFQYWAALQEARQRANASRFVEM